MPALPLAEIEMGDAERELGRQRARTDLFGRGRCQFSREYQQYEISPELCRAARALLGWSQQELATRACVARKTIADFELGRVTPQSRTLREIVATFDAGGIELLPAEEHVSRGGSALEMGCASQAAVTAAQVRSAAADSTKASPGCDIC
jgi:transcriptional regulator with XRE-family HTH domain